MRLVILLGIAALVFANSAEAGLGWTLEECKKHYGEPVETKNFALGVTTYDFSAKDYMIHVGIGPDGKVGMVAYMKPSISSDVAPLRKE